MKTVKFMIWCVSAFWMAALLTGCGGGPVGTLNAPDGTVTITRVALTDRWPVDCDVSKPSCIKFNSNALIVWVTLSENMGLSSLMSAYVLDKDGQKYTAGGNGLENGVFYISFNQVDTSTGFSLYWLDNPPLSLGK